MIYTNKSMRRCLVSIAIVLGVTLVDVTSVLAADDVIIYEDKDTLLIDAEQTLLDETSDNDGSSVIGEQLEDRSSGEEAETIEQPEGILSDESSIIPSSGQDVLINEGTEEIIVPFYDAQPDDEGICVETRADDIIQYGGYPSEVPHVDRSSKLLGATGDTYKYKAAVDKAAETLRGWNGTASAISVDFTSYNIPKEDCNGLFSAVINSHPELFYITDTYEYYYKGNKLTSIKFNIDSSYSKSDVDKFNNKVSAIIKGVNSSWTDMQKLIYIHDYLALHINYDTTQKYYNAYNALIDGKCVCEGYALAYSYLVNKINSNFDCLVISSKVNNHAWNMVTLGGRKYYVDVTGDDRPGSYEFHEMHHNNIVSRAKLISSNNHEGKDWIDQYGKNVYSIETGTNYDSVVWRNMESPMPMVGNKGVYYTGSDPMNIYLYDFSNGKSSLLKSYKAEWEIWKTGKFYACSFSSLATLGNRVIVTLPDTIKVIDLSGNEVGSYASKSNAGYIYGARLDGNELSYDVHTSPASNETKHIGRYKQTIGSDVAVTGVTLNPTTMKLTMGGTSTGQLTATISPSNASNKTVTWSSSNTSVATVDGNGKVTARGRGNATITVKTNDKGKTAKCNVTVEWLDCKWSVVGGKSYWYEKGVKQGTYSDPHGVMGDGTVRGREIFDPASNAWYWLDSVYDGAKAVGKEVWMPYVYQDEKKWSDADKRRIANESDPGMGDQVYKTMKEGRGKWVRYDENGKMLKGWVTISGELARIYPKQKGNTYYYDNRTGLMAKGKTVIGGKTYYFDEVTGVLK